MQLSKLTRRSLSGVLLTLSMLVAMELSSSVANVFLTLNGSGTQDGLTCANSKPTSFFNNGANWGAGAAQIGPGTVVHICTMMTVPDVTNVLTVQGDGGVGNPVTILFEPGAGMQSVRFPTIYNANGPGAISTGGHSNITIDGGTNGVIRNTDTGQGKTVRSLVNGTGFIIVNNGNNITIKNLELGPTFVRYGISTLSSIVGNGSTATVTCAVTCLTAPGEGMRITNASGAFNIVNFNVASTIDTTHFTFASGVNGTATGGLVTDVTDFGSAAHNDIGSIYVTGSASNVLIDHNKIHDCGWCIITAVQGGTGGFTVSNNEIYNMDHGIAPDPFGSGQTLIPTYFFTRNHLHDMDNWDTGAATNYYHHDGIHGFYTGTQPGGIQDLWVSDNTFDGNSGINTTAWIFLESNGSNWCPTNGHIHLINNVFVGTIDNDLVGVYSGGAGGSGHEAYGNTFLIEGGNTTQHTAFKANSFASGSKLTMKNNYFGGASNPISITDTSLTTFVADYNVYSTITPQGNNVWKWQGHSDTNSFATWQNAGTGSPVIDVHGIANFGAPFQVSLSTYVPISSSLLTTVTGNNLTSLGIAILNADKNGSPRPGGTITPWDVGAVNASGGAPVVSISVTPNPLAFGSQLTGTSTPGSATVTTTGTGTLILGTPALVLGGTDAGQFSLTGGGCANGQTVSSTCSANVTFSPTTAGAKAATLTVNSNASTAPTVINLTGMGTAPATPVLTPVPTSVAFGNNNVGQTSAPTTITLTSSGATVNLGNPFFTIAGAIFARSGGTCINSMVLTPPASCTVLVTATPAALGAASSNLVINSNSSPGVSVPLSVTGTAPSITVAPLSFDFGSQIQGTQGPLHNFTITNNGTGPATMGNPYFSFNDAQFARVSPGGADCINGGSLAPGANCLISVAFTPSAPGARSGVLSILSNAPTVTAALSGTGTASTPAPVMAPASFAFPSTTTGTTSSTTVTFTLTNNGSSLTLANPPGNLTGTNASDFTLIGGTCAAGTVLGTTASCTYTYNFHPAAAGSKVATANSTGSVTTSSGLSGTGVAPVLSIQLSPRPLNFPNQTIGVISAVALVTVTNNGAASVTIATGGAALGGANPGDFSISSSGATTCHDGLALAVAATCNYGLQITPSFAAPPAESATFTVTTTAGVSDFIQLNGSGVALFPPPSPAPAQLVGITLPGYFINWYGPSDFFGIVGSGFINGRTIVTLDGQPLPTNCLNAESCSATLPLAMVLLPGFAGSPHTIGVK